MPHRSRLVRLGLLACVCSAAWGSALDDLSARVGEMEGTHRSIHEEAQRQRQAYQARLAEVRKTNAQSEDAQTLSSRLREIDTKLETIDRQTTELRNKKVLSIEKADRDKQLAQLADERASLAAERFEKRKTLDSLLKQKDDGELSKIRSSALPIVVEDDHLEKEIAKARAAIAEIKSDIARFVTQGKDKFTGEQFVLTSPRSAEGIDVLFRVSDQKPGTASMILTASGTVDSESGGRGVDISGSTAILLINGQDRISVPATVLDSRGSEFIRTYINGNVLESYRERSQTVIVSVAIPADVFRKVAAAQTFEARLGKVDVDLTGLIRSAMLLDCSVRLADPPTGTPPASPPARPSTPKSTLAVPGNV